MQDRMDAQERKPTVRERLDKLHALMTEALQIGAQIIGDELRERDMAVRKSDNPALDVIELDLDRAIERAVEIVGQLKRIEERL